MKNACYIVVTASIIIFACINSDVFRSGCTQGIQLWYTSIVPILLPFMLLTGVITSFLDSMHVSSFGAYAIIFIIGLLCGFPTGTIIISFFHRKGLIPEKVCQSLLPMCNNISPMFLYNYIYRDHLMGLISFGRIIEAVYIPQIIYTAITLALSYMQSRHDAGSSVMLAAATAPIPSGRKKGDSDKAYSDIISSSVHNITVIGVYMVIFAIAGNLVCKYFTGDVSTIISAYLEIGGGVSILNSMELTAKIKTALILSLTAFGGLSALFQSRDMIRISGLSFIKYTTGKTVCALLCFIFYMICL